MLIRYLRLACHRAGMKGLETEQISNWSAGGGIKPKSENGYNQGLGMEAKKMLVLTHTLDNRTTTDYSGHQSVWPAVRHRRSIA